MARSRVRRRKPNRTDLTQPVRTAPSDTYGDRAASERAQQTIPLPARSGGGASAPPPPEAPVPGSLGMNAPSAYANEPVTTGLPVGPGAGPEVLSPIAPQPRSVVEMLAALPDASPELRALASDIEATRLAPDEIALEF